MSIGVVDATLKVTGFKKLQDQASKASKSIVLMSDELDKASGGFKAMGVAAGAAFGAIALASNKAVKAFGTQIKAERSLEMAFKGLGDEASGAAQEIKDLAAQLQKTTTFGDEATIQAAAFLRIQGMTKDQIKSALPVIQDFAAVTGQDLSKASILAGRAMTGSVKVLERYIGSIDDSTAATINSLGPQEKAAAVAELLRQKVGGQAAILRQSGVGAMQAYSNAVGDLWEEMGKLIDRPVREFFEESIVSVEAMTSALGNLAPWAKETLVTVGKFALVFSGAAAAIAAVALVIPQIVTGLGLMKTAFLVMKPAILGALLPVAAFIATAAALAVVIAGVRKTWEDFGSAFVFAAKEMFLSVLDIVKIWSRNVTEFFGRVLDSLLAGVKKMINTLGQLAFALGFEDLAKDVKAFENISFEMDLGLVGDAAKAASEIASKTFSSAAGAASSAGNGIAKAFGQAFDHVRDGFGLLKKDIAGALFVDPATKAAAAVAGDKDEPGGGAGPKGKGKGGSAAFAAAEAKKTSDKLSKISTKFKNDLAKEAADFAADQERKRVGRIQAGFGAVGAAAGGNIGGAVTGAFAAAGSALGPMASGALGLVDTFAGMSEAGRQFKESLGGAVSEIGETLAPLFDVLNVVLGIVMDTLGPIIEFLGAQFKIAAIYILFFIRGVRRVYISLLKLIDFITPGFLDLSDTVAELEQAQQGTIKKQHELQNSMGKTADAAKEAASSMLNIPRGVKVAAARFAATTAQAGTREFQDFIQRPGQAATNFSPDDTVIGVKDPAALGGGGTIVLQNVHINANDPTAFFQNLLEMVNRDHKRGGQALGGMFQGRP